MMKYYTYTWDLLEVYESAFLASFKTQATPIDPPAQSINQQATKNSEKDQTPNKSYHIVLVYIHKTEG